MAKGQAKQKKCREHITICFRDDTIKMDKEHLILYASHAWYTVKSHNVKYLVRNGTTGIIQFHREIMKDFLTDGLEVDHINGNGLDNRTINLRAVTHLQNQNNIQNKKRIGTSRYRYVHYDKSRNRWCAMVQFKGKTKNVGSFNTELLAALAANSYILKNRLDKVLNVI